MGYLKMMAVTGQYSIPEMTARINAVNELVYHRVARSYEAVKNRIYTMDITNNRFEALKKERQKIGKFLSEGKGDFFDAEVIFNKSESHVRRCLKEFNESNNQ